MDRKYKLSIIIPYYNTEKYIDELLITLDRQITEEVEVLIIDDGSFKPLSVEYTWAKVIRKENGGVSSARNLGLDESQGQYIAFIDSDDMISDNYIELILNKINSVTFDWCYLSWETYKSNKQYQKIIKSIKDEFDSWNLSVWNRVYNWDIIKDIRFNENVKFGEDGAFLYKITSLCKKKIFISSIVYKYRADAENSLTKRFNSGTVNNRRIVYYYKHITKDMSYLIKQIKYFSSKYDVIVMTEQNDLKELYDLCVVIPPRNIKGTELRGEPTNLFTKVDNTIYAEVALFIDKIWIIGGIETFLYNFTKNMGNEYDILLLYKEAPNEQLDRLPDTVRHTQYNPETTYICNTFVINKIYDFKPENVFCNSVIRLVHGCKLAPNWSCPADDADLIIPVSKEVQKSWATEWAGKPQNIVHNFVETTKPRRVLRLISLTRLTHEKGGDRMLEMAEMLNKNNIPFIWLVFSNKDLDHLPHGMVRMEPTFDPSNYIADSDYLVQLSDSEGFGYSIVESLCLNTPVIVTDLPVLEEIGVKDGVNAHVVPFDMNFDINKIYNNIPKFNYEYKNEKIKEEWIKIFDKFNTKDNLISNKRAKIKTIKRYYSLALKRQVEAGEILETDIERARILIDRGYATL